MKGYRTKNSFKAYIPLILFFSFFLIPMLWILYASFKTGSSITNLKLFSLEGFTMKNYKEVLGRGDFLLYSFNSLIIALSVTLISLVIGVIGGYSLSRYNIKLKNVWISTIFVAQMFPGVLLIIPLYNLMLNYHMVDSIIGIILAQSTLTLPFSVWLLKGFFDSIPRSLDEAAMLDGCGVLRTIWSIILPVSIPGIAIAAFYSFVVSWGNYLMASVLVQSNSTATLPIALYRLASSLTLQWGNVAAATVLITLPTIVLFAVFQKWLVSGLLGGAVKQ
ncbi:MAG: carbohydrate ABC transporter permease [Synergistetes bacterium]|nr:carbohydrate ABC transporter permease [Synergistota bacterium]